MTKTLQEADILRTMREEWTAKTAQLAEQIDIVMHSKVEGPEKESVLAPELKIRHKKSQIRYTVVSVGPRDIILKTPEGEQFLIDKETCENEYELD
jgi:hypothetical protein